ncbi:MAG: response regulator transcription factor [Gemmataceae bacterium]
MKLLIVEDNKAFRGFLRLGMAEQAGENIPDVFEAATLVDAIRIVREEAVDAVLSDGAFPPDWGDHMGDPARWRDSCATLRKECSTHDVPFVLLRGNPLGRLSMARSAIEQVLALPSTHQMASVK